MSFYKAIQELMHRPKRLNIKSALAELARALVASGYVGQNRSQHLQQGAKLEIEPLDMPKEVTVFETKAELHKVKKDD